MKEFIEQQIEKQSLSFTREDFLGLSDTENSLVLLDMILPDTNGLLVLQQLQRSRPDLPVVMLTGLGSESDVVVGLEMGADDYVVKPFSLRELTARVEAILRRVSRSASEKRPLLQATGIEINPEYCTLAKQRIGGDEH